MGDQADMKPKPTSAWAICSDEGEILILTIESSESKCRRMCNPLITKLKSDALPIPLKLEDIGYRCICVNITPAESDNEAE